MTSLPVKDRGPGGKRDRGLRQPLTSGKKGIAGSDKSHDDGKPLTRWKIRSRGQGGFGREREELPVTSLPVKDRGPGGKRDRGLRQPLTSGKKGIAGSDKSHDDGKPLTRWKIRSRAQGGFGREREELPVTSLPVKDRGPGGKRDRGLRQPLTSGKKGIAGSDKSRDDGKPLTRWKIRSRAQGGLKPLEKTRAQSPKSNFRNGGRYKRVNPKVRE